MMSKILNVPPDGLKEIIGRLKDGAGERLRPDLIVEITDECPFLETIGKNLRLVMIYAVTKNRAGKPGSVLGLIGWNEEGMIIKMIAPLQKLQNELMTENYQPFLKALTTTGITPRRFLRLVAVYLPV